MEGGNEGGREEARKRDTYGSKTMVGREGGREGGQARTILILVKA